MRGTNSPRTMHYLNKTVVGRGFNTPRPFKQLVQRSVTRQHRHVIDKSSSPNTTDALNYILEYSEGWVGGWVVR